MSDARRRLLGGLSPRAFLARHWQKEALRIPAALPGFRGPFDLPALKRLAQRDDVESRLVVREGATWTLRHGPLRPADFRDLPPQRWTLLVQGVNLHEPACDALLRRFAFVPYARLDDVMVSYAAPGGGVGPHLDNYDVFLLQGFGRRRWRYGRQQDAAFRPGLPLRILRRFAPTHDARASRPATCSTCRRSGRTTASPSTPARPTRSAFAPPPCRSSPRRSSTSCATRSIFPAAMPTRTSRRPATPARIPAAMRRQVAKLLQGLRWDEATVGRFLGRIALGAQADRRVRPASAPLSAAAFRKRVGAKGVHLDRARRLLYDDGALYVNGSSHGLTAGDAPLRHLADARALAAATCRSARAPAASHDSTSGTAMATSPPAPEALPPPEERRLDTLAAQSRGHRRAARPRHAAGAGVRPRPRGERLGPCRARRAAAGVPAPLAQRRAAPHRARHAPARDDLPADSPRCSRLYGHAMTIWRTGAEEARSATDALLIADGRHACTATTSEQPRATLAAVDARRGQAAGEPLRGDLGDRGARDRRDDAGALTVRVRQRGRPSQSGSSTPIRRPTSR